MAVNQQRQSPVAFLAEKIDIYIAQAKENRANDALWKAYHECVIDMVKALQLMSLQMKQREIVDLRLSVALWIKDANIGVSFAREAEILEKMLA